jgi:hypothetical protein
VSAHEVVRALEVDAAGREPEARLEVERAAAGLDLVGPDRVTLLEDHHPLDDYGMSLPRRLRNGIVRLASPYL